jgi:hypothetical protein
MRLVGMRGMRRALLALLLAAAVAPVAAMPLAANAAPPPSSNPCDYVPLPSCTTALGPLVDVTAGWRWYQPALVQPIPMSDYSADPAINAPFPFSPCGGETSTPAANGQAVPPSSPQAPPVAGVPAPPGGWRVGTQYCVLRYLATDFTAPCATCTRVLVDYDRIPAASVPGADGHWAGRFTFNGGFTVAIPQVNGHSPNVKNLCADKYFNKGAGSDCTDMSGVNSLAPITQFDKYGMGLEGDSGVYHHFSGEGRYYNGPAYLAGDGSSVPYHWVHGVYQDYDLQGAGSGFAWYGAGYRGLGDAAPDTDLWPPGYACACEVPPVGHSTLSTTFEVKALTAPSPAPSATTAAGAGSGGGSVLPPTTAGLAPAVLAALGLVALALGAASVTLRPRARRPR